MNTSYRAGDSSSLVPIDAIQEFSAQQNPKAESGFRDGSSVNVGVKSGTNGIHGTAYAFGRDANATDAGNYFIKAIAPNPGVASAPAVTPATLEQFGATAGGRIIKDKLFWFASYEGLRLTVGDVNVLTMPSLVAMTAAADPQNQLSIVDACKALGPAKINSVSAQLAGLNPATCVVTPGSPSFENVFPGVNSATSTSFVPQLTSTGPLNNGLFKIDYNIGAKHHLNGMYYRSSATQTSNTIAGQTEPQWLVTVPQNAYQYDGDWTWTPNSTW